MDQWNMRSASQFSQQPTQGGSAQYSYNSSGYVPQQQQQQQQQQAPQQQQQQNSGATYTQQAYLQQAVIPQGGYATAAYGGVWSQRAPQQQGEQSQAGYGGRQLASTGGASANQYTSQYGGGVYGLTQQQQLLGVPSKGSEYQASGGGASRSSNAYGGGVQDRPVGSGASYVTGGVNVSGAYGTDSSKYLAGYGKAVEYGAPNQYNTQKPSVDPYLSTSSYPKPDNYATQVYEQLQQQDGANGTTAAVARVSANTGYGTSGADASGLLASLAATGAMPGGSLTPQPTNAYAGGRGMAPVQVYPASPTMGYGGVSLPPGREYGSSRVSTGGSMFQREGSYGRSERPSIGSSRFDDRERDREREQREREDRDREREKEHRERERRERERERERREEERRRERTPPRMRKESPAKRDDKIIRRESPRPPHRHASPTKEKRREYVCKLETSNLLEAVRSSTSIAKRYSRLAISPDFSKFVMSWMGKEDNILLEKSISFEHESIDVEDEPEPTETTPKSVDKPKASVVWNVKVMLTSGLTEESIGELLSDKTDKPTNFNKMLKFVALRRDRNAIMAAAGRWDKSLDGGDPAVDDNALIRTAVRSLKELVQLDLSECKDWVRFGEIHYERVDNDGCPSHKEISVILLPDLSGCVPSVENWTLLWTQRKQSKKEAKVPCPIDKEAEKEGANGPNTDNKSDTPAKEEKKEKEGKEKKEEVPPEPGFVLTTKRSKSTKLRSMTISLDGLLDYDENDKDECTFELSLFAETFAEMLQFRKGSQILANLETLRKASLTRKRDERKRSRQTQNENEAKKAKTESIKPASEEAPKPEVKQTAEESQDKELPVSDGDLMKVPATPVPESDDSSKKEKEKEKNGNVKKEKTEKKEKKTVVDKELLKAYRYFDRNKLGYLKGDDVKRLLNSLGHYLTPRAVKDLVNCGVAETGRSRDDKIYYRSLTDKEVS